MSPLQSDVIMNPLSIRPRRNRASKGRRDLVRETSLNASHLVYPLFVQDGKNQETPISSLPNCSRLSPDLIVREAREAHGLGIPGIALFPAIEESLKDKRASESRNPDGLLPRTIKMIKDAVPEMIIITDVAMDPYSSDGHDGVVENGEILNDDTLPILADMALTQARAGADIVAPSDMMDGRVGYIRRALDESGFKDVGILSYAVKYASAFYGPFRDALESAPKSGDKKTYQMDPANAREALREVELDVREGADIVMVKPALPYLDILSKVRDTVNVPVAAYQVSGEHSMIHAGAKEGWLDLDAAIEESLISIRRAGADIIFTYAAKSFASC